MMQMGCADMNSIDIILYNLALITVLLLGCLFIIMLVIGLVTFGEFIESCLCRWIGNPLLRFLSALFVTLWIITIIGSVIMLMIK